MEQFLTEWRKTKTELILATNQNKDLHYYFIANEQVAIVLVLRLIDWQEGASFLNRS